MLLPSNPDDEDPGSDDQGTEYSDQTISSISTGLLKSVTFDSSLKVTSIDLGNISNIDATEMTITSDRDDLFVNSLFLSFARTASVPSDVNELGTLDNGKVINTRSINGDIYYYWEFVTPDSTSIFITLIATNCTELSTTDTRNTIQAINNGINNISIRQTNVNRKVGFSEECPIGSVEFSGTLNMDEPISWSGNSISATVMLECIDLIPTPLIEFNFYTDPQYRTVTPHVTIVEGTDVSWFEADNGYAEYFWTQKDASGLNDVYVTLHNYDTNYRFDADTLSTIISNISISLQLQTRFIQFTDSAISAVVFNKILGGSEPLSTSSDSNTATVTINLAGVENMPCTTTFTFAFDESYLNLQSVYDTLGTLPSCSSETVKYYIGSDSKPVYAWKHTVQSPNGYVKMVLEDEDAEMTLSQINYINNWIALYNY